MPALYLALLPQHLMQAAGASFVEPVPALSIVRLSNACLELCSMSAVTSCEHMCCRGRCWLRSKRSWQVLCNASRKQPTSGRLAWVLANFWRVLSASRRYRCARVQAPLAAVRFLLRPIACWLAALLAHEACARHECGCRLLLVRRLCAVCSQRQIRASC